MSPNRALANRVYRAMGMRPVVIDSGEEKEKLVKRCGAEAFIDFKKEADIPARVREVCDGVGAHGVLVTAWQTYKGLHISLLRLETSLTSHIQIPLATLVVVLAARSSALVYLLKKRIAHWMYPHLYTQDCDYP